MKFGPVRVAECEGAILAHSQKLGAVTFKKGRRLSAEDVVVLTAAGVGEVIAARFDPGDVPEDEAAARVAAAVAGTGLSQAAPFTGRANLIAASEGLLCFDPARLDALNLVHEDVTLATLPAFTRVAPKQMVATVKIIPFAVPGGVLERCLASKRGASRSARRVMLEPPQRRLTRRLPRLPSA